MKSPQKDPTKLNPGWVAFFRVNIALIALLSFLSLQADFEDVYSFRAYVFPDIMDASYHHYTPTIYSIWELFSKGPLPIPYESLLWFFRILYPIALIALGLGIRTRGSAVLSLFLQLLMSKSIHLYEYGFDAFLTISLFYCCIFPVGKVYSWDARKSREGLMVEHPLFLRFLQIHLSIAYFFSGFEKVVGVTWRNGEAIWKTLHSHNYYSAFNLDFLSDTPFFLISGWLTVIVELAYPLFMNLPSLRRYWLIGVIGMHLFIAFFMGLFFFAGIMIVLNIAAFYAPYIASRPENQPVNASALNN